MPADSSLTMESFHLIDDSTRAEVTAIDDEIQGIKDQIIELEIRQAELEDLRQSILSQAASSLPKAPAPVAKNYDNEDFEWSNQLKRLAKDHWGITQWRDKQLSVMNASLDNRDTFVLMPTVFFRHVSPADDFIKVEESRSAISFQHY
ncbi:hypothetical protein BGW38_005790 [Lunasporangiospora selenospora]|uniref:Uncharacterized protein n=1 Tax=Lunasporangiospora selenospora TaxID=979761 RepID=A0A9P6G1L7_9FUNG|nr:hypothetical protein BGW38_005790 [Lunasporangiospora selenospora]